MLLLALGLTGGLHLSRLPSLAQVNGESLLQQGDAAGNAGNLVAARQAYERAIAAGVPLQQDAARARRLGLWYMDGEPHDYHKAAQWLTFSLQANESDDETRLWLAKVLSWDHQYERSVTEYCRLLEKHPGDAELKRQLARVLSWSRKYSESLAVYDELVRSPAADDAMRVERARVLSWARRYGEAQQQYAEVLQRDPRNLDARIGQAQVLYWSGKPGPAMQTVRAVLKDDPNNPQANFLLAALEHNRGQNAAALKALQLGPSDQETRDLRDSIAREQRPVLHLRFGYDNDLEQPTGGFDSTYRALRYTASFTFNLTPSVRMEVANVVTQNDTSTPVLAQFGRDALSTQTMARISFSPRPWLRMTAGAGGATTGKAVIQNVTADRQQHFIYELTPTVTFGNVRVDVSATRSIADYTPLSVLNNLAILRESVAASYTWRKRVRLGGEYWHGNYRLDQPGPLLTTSADGGALSFLPILYGNDRVSVEAGVRYNLFRFADETVRMLDPATSAGSSGIFMPRFYQRYSGTGSLWLTPRKGMRLGFNGSYGPQRVFGFPALSPPAATWGNTGNIGFQWSVRFGDWEPYVEGNYFSTETPASPGLSQGSFSAYSLAGGLRLRF